jgi:hypothetical protein
LRIDTDQVLEMTSIFVSCRFGRLVLEIEQFSKAQLELQDSDARVENSKANSDHPLKFETAD